MRTINHFSPGMIAIWLLLLLASPHVSGDDFPWLSSLETGDQVKNSGKRLVDIPHGLHALEPKDKANVRMLIAVHGWRSEGYEWVYPLQAMDSDQTRSYFFRWDYGECPIESGRLLIREITNSLESQPHIKTLVLIGHSLGGVLVASIADLMDFQIESEIHVIAAPLQGISNDSCPDQRLPEKTSTKTDFYQWRTQHQLDNAFNRLPEDPQVVDIPHSVVIRLPETYNDRRLGHNWSISWVAERLKEK